MNSKSFASSMIAVAVLTLGHGVAEATTIRTGIGFEASGFVGDFGTTPPQDFVSAGRSCSPSTMIWWVHTSLRPMLWI